jgi:hypothetical protein
MHLAIKRLARAATIAVAIVVSPGSLAATRPLIATLGDVAFKLTAGLSEVEAVRRKITGADARRSSLLSSSKAAGSGEHLSTLFGGRAWAASGGNINDVVA